MGLFSSIASGVGKLFSGGAGIVAGSLISGGLGFLGAKEQADAAGDAAKEQLRMYYQSRADLAPWREAGARSLADLERIQKIYEGAVMRPQEWVKDPGYTFLYQQGLDAVGRGASARGKLDSGEYLKDLTKYGQGMASTGYENYLSRLERLMNRYSGTSGIGQTATSNTAYLAQGAGQAQAAGRIGEANARTGLYGNLSNIISSGINQYNLLKAMSPQSPSQTGYGTQPFNPAWYGGV